MKRIVVTVALSLAVALVVGLLYRRDLTQRREIDAAITDLESMDREVVQSAVKFLSQSQRLYAARRLAESLATYGSGAFRKRAIITAIEKSGARGLSAILDILTADPGTLPEEMILGYRTRSWLMRDARTVVRKMRGEAVSLLVPLAAHRDPRSREVAAELLGATGDRRAARMLRYVHEGEEVL